MLTYHHPIAGHDIAVFIYDDFAELALISAANAVAKEHGIALFWLSHPDDIRQITTLAHRKVMHVILRLCDVPEPARIERIVSLLPVEYRSVSFAFSYASPADSLRYQPQIERMKAKYHDLDCFNMMRADTFHQTRFTCSILKIKDNIICDTLRIKYKAICTNAGGEIALPQHVKHFFSQAAELYAQHRMFHRASTDGYFAFRDEETVYITATKTPKDATFDPARISVLHRYDEDENQLYYAGTYLPSSDSVEAMILLTTWSDINSIIHTHDSVRFTRNVRYADHHRVAPMEYGTAALGHALAEVAGKDRSFIIMEEHGEIFLGRGGNQTACNTVEQALDEYSVAAIRRQLR